MEPVPSSSQRSYIPCQWNFLHKSVASEEPLQSSEHFRRAVRGESAALRSQGGRSNCHSLQRGAVVNHQRRTVQVNQPPAP